MAEKETREEAPVPPEGGAPADAVPEVSGPKRKRRRWLRILFWLPVTVAVLLAAVILVRDMIVETAIRKVGTMATGTGVEIDSFSSSLLRGRVELAGLRVANPPGYRNPDAFVFDRIVVEVRPGSLLSDTIEVGEIRVEGMRVDFEATLSGSNLTDIQKNIEAFAGGGSSSEAGADVQGAPVSGTEPEAAEKSGAARKKVVIHRLMVMNNSLTFSSAMLQTTLPLVLPDIEMSEVGGGQSLGETMNQMMITLLKAVSQAISQAGINAANIQALSDSLTRAGDSVVDAGADAVKTGTQALKEGADAIKGAGDGVTKALDDVSGLFRKK